MTELMEFDSANLPNGMTLEITHKVEREPGDEAGYSFLDYVFVFPNGRLIAARTYLDTFSGQTEIGLCGCWEESAEDVNALGPDCLEWPEFRDSLIALTAFGFKIILWPGEEEYEPFDITGLKIDDAAVADWSVQATKTNPFSGED
jgi:hypothetical protein